MGSVYLQEIGGLPPVEVEDAASASGRWRRWIRGFELYAAGKGVTDPDQKMALLLHTAGLRVHDIFFTLPTGQGEDNYSKATNALRKYFIPQANVPFERNEFRNMSQQANETVEQFITRLRQKSETCEFGDNNAIDEQIRDQVINKCLSYQLRMKLLEKGRTLTLQQLRDIARAREDAARQASSIEGRKTDNSVNKITVQGKSSRQTGIECYNCGRPGHIARDSKCPAWDKKCRKCKKMGHFEKKCHAKLEKQEKSKFGRGRASQRFHRRVNEVHESDEDEYDFSVSDSENNEAMIEVNVGGIPLKMIIDSGASCNIVDKETWEYLKNKHVKCKSSRDSKKPYAYGSKTSLNVAGTFVCDLSYQSEVLSGVKIVVIDGKGHALLGRETAIKLGVLKLGPNVNYVTETDGRSIKDKFPQCFQGIGKLKDFQLRIPIDESVDPVIQQVRRIRRTGKARHH